MSLEKFYMKKYKILLLIPLIIFLASLLILTTQKANNGYFIDKDVSLKGGISVTLYTSEEINLDNLESQFLEQFPDSDISIRKLSSLATSQKTGVIFEATDISTEEVRGFIKEKLNTEEISIQEIGSGLGETFFKEMIAAIIFAFLLMGIVVFITFRKFIPSLAVILSAALDIIGTLAVVSLLEIKLSSAGIAAFLMVIGYSIDTDILLTTRLIKRKEGSIFERMESAFKTGIIMTVTTLIALTVAFLATNSLILKQMFGIIIIALIIDLISTWIMNTGMLVWYLKKNENKQIY